MSGLRPQTFAGGDGLRVDFQAQTVEGLEVSGAALLSVRNSKLNAIVFLAPKEYYFPQHIDEVEAVFKSASLTK
jgi:hypothetical protein